jgi:hypothetical protein
MTRHPLCRMLGGDPGPVWTGTDNLASIGIRPLDGPTRSESYRLSHPGTSAPIYLLLFHSSLLPFTSTVYTSVILWHSFLYLRSTIACNFCFHFRSPTLPPLFSSSPIFLQFISPRHSVSVFLYTYQTPFSLFILFLLRCKKKISYYFRCSNFRLLAFTAADQIIRRSPSHRSVSQVIRRSAAAACSGWHCSR